jgi:riboflavin kinase/FMN adenylyltransferase
MKIITSLSEALNISGPIALTIGVFDGMHLGHQQVIRAMHDRVKSFGSTVIVTFANHPDEIIQQKKTSFIYDQKNKFRLLEKEHIDYVVVLNFTKELALMEYDSFLAMIKSKINFSYLFLGEIASFGKDKKGSQDNIRATCQKLNFEVVYMPFVEIGGNIVSSTQIRQALMNRDFVTANALLGHPYTLFFSATQRGELVKTPHVNVLSLFSKNIIVPEGKYSVVIAPTNEEKFSALLSIKKSKLSLFYMKPFQLEDFSLSFTSLDNKDELVCQISPVAL